MDPTVQSLVQLLARCERIIQAHEQELARKDEFIQALKDEAKKPHNKKV